MASAVSTPLARVVLKRGREGPVRGGNPRIFSQAIERIEPPSPNPLGSRLSCGYRWYCRMRQTAPSARPADVKYWSAMEEKVLMVMAPTVEEKRYPAKKKNVSRGLGSV